MQTMTLAHDLERTLTDVVAVLRTRARSGRSITALLTLRHLEDHGPARVTELAAAQQVAQPTMTTLIGRLAGEGLVARSADPSDARAALVAITDAGRAELAEVRDARQAELRRRLDALSGDERAALAAAIPALQRILT